MSNALTELYVSYSKSASGKLNLTNNFTVGEFACQDGSDPVIINVIIPLICQAVRNWFGKAYTPNSAYRTVSHNVAVKGANKSYHIYGKAVDIPTPAGSTPKQLYDFLDKLCGDSCEIGIYSWGVHVGITDTKKRFIDSSYKG